MSVKAAIAARPLSPLAGRGKVRGRSVEKNGAGDPSKIENFWN
jgi:hypothetical protein